MQASKAFFNKKLVLNLKVIRIRGKNFWFFFVRSKSLIDPYYRRCILHPPADRKMTPVFYNPYNLQVINSAPVQNRGQNYNRVTKWGYFETKKWDF